MPHVAYSRSVHSNKIVSMAGFVNLTSRKTLATGFLIVAGFAAIYYTFYNDRMISNHLEVLEIEFGIDGLNNASLVV